MVVDGYRHLPRRVDSVPGTARCSMANLSLQFDCTIHPTRALSVHSTHNAPDSSIGDAGKDGICCRWWGWLIRTQDPYVRCLLWFLYLDARFHRVLKVIVCANGHILTYQGLRAFSSWHRSGVCDSRYVPSAKKVLAFMLSRSKHFLFFNILDFQSLLLWNNDQKIDLVFNNDYK